MLVWERMRTRNAVLAGFGLLGCLYAQQAPTVPYVDPQIAAMFNHIAERAGLLDPMLRQVRADEWVAKGAPDTYVAQLATAKQQIHVIQSEMGSLALRPDQMREAMNALFRVQSFHRALDSLMGGLRRYQNPALADLIQSVAAEDQSSLDALQEYILELAKQKDQEFQVVEHEAQRCRATLSQAPKR